MLTLATLSRNAYRTLGLTAGASQMDIDSAARQMRIWDDPAHIPPTPNDALWLGPVFREKKDIEQAVARLADPKTRVHERLWWFCGPPPTLETLHRPPASPLDPARHDGLLVALHRALITDTRGHLEHWQTLLAQAQKLAHSDDYLAWLLDAESNGDFEKRASVDEIAAAQMAMAATLAASLQEGVDDALDAGDYESVRRVVELLREHGPRDAGEEPAETAILNRMEDLQALRCEELQQQVSSAWQGRQIAVIRPRCFAALSSFDSTVLPLQTQLTMAAGDDEDRKQRARVQGAKLLAFLSEAYVAIHDNAQAERVLKRSLDMASGTTFEPIVAGQMRELQATKPRWGWRKAPTGETSSSSSDGGSWSSSFSWHYVWLIVIVLRLLVTCSSHTTPSLSTPSISSEDIQRQIQIEQNRQRPPQARGGEPEATPANWPSVPTLAPKLPAIQPPAAPAAVADPLANRMPQRQPFIPPPPRMPEFHPPSTPPQHPPPASPRR